MPPTDGMSMRVAEVAPQGACSHDSCRRSWAALGLAGSVEANRSFIQVAGIPCRIGFALGFGSRAAIWLRSPVRPWCDRSGLRAWTSAAGSGRREDLLAPSAAPAPAAPCATALHPGVIPAVVRPSMAGIGHGLAVVLRAGPWTARSDRGRNRRVSRSVCTVVPLSGRHRWGPAVIRRWRPILGPSSSPELSSNQGLQQ